MKKIVKVMALAMALVILTCACASCFGPLSGTYAIEEFGSSVELKFSGNKVTITYDIMGLSVDPIEAKYSIDGDKITFEFADADADDSIIQDLIEGMEGTFDFEKGDGYIKIDGTKYEKK